LPETALADDVVHFEVLLSRDVGYRLEVWHDCRFWLLLLQGLPDHIFQVLGGVLVALDVADHGLWRGLKYCLLLRLTHYPRVLLLVFVLTHQVQPQ
jgi:hypothetical protein